MKKQYKKWLLYSFVKVKLSCQINLTIGMTCRQETKHKNTITVKGQKKFENEIFRNKIKYTYAP